MIFRGDSDSMSVWWYGLLFSFRKKFRVDLGELTKEKEPLSRFLGTALSVEVTSDDHSLLVDAKNSSPQELHRLVNKFIYRQHLNNRHWVALEGNTVRIHTFERKKQEKKKKPGLPPSTIKHGW
jgi:hypothetical protein